MEKRNFEERLKAYQAGWLSPEEEVAIEVEIDKARAIQDYLFAEDFQADMELEFSETIDSQAIQKNVKRRFIKQGVIIGMAVLVSLLLLYFLVWPLVNNFYLNPLTGKSKYRPSDYELYQWAQNYVYTDGDLLTGVFIEGKGLGSYEVKNTYFNAFTNKHRFDSVTLKRNEVIYQARSGDYLDLGDLSMFSTAADFGGRKNESLERKIAQISALPESAWLKVAINFGQSLSIDELESFIREEEILRPLYTKVEVTEEMEGIPQTNFGFRFNRSLVSTGLAIGNKEKKVLDEEYPQLFRTDLFNSASEAEVVREHFISALTYLVDHQGDVPSEEIPAEFPEDASFQPAGALAYVKKHGVKVVRLIVAIPKGEFESLVKNSQINAIGVPEVSMYAPYLETRIF
ncbi:anti sigma factor C-terminal domain-containing protein [Vagococcus sp. BWB3-3]|uniref:Anti sigma factor C-terminal domain-containing protein n=1 Tax=Vagococcus allomyrinae TaxID=2794353 RepID=A0A940P4W6_9ENTE|nr:anti sigma factor C-terminal domain-containing protein [Vagococcus allomyrinae]MBP1039796.1 anti sigma factor C-terminal domain-containing protein [Vagococcus allomyrinae]